MKTYFIVLRTSDWREHSPFNRTTSLSIQRRDLKIAVQPRSPSNLTELEKICREEWEKLHKYRCAKLVAS